MQQALQRASNGAFSGGAASASCSSSASSSSPQTLSTYGASGQKPDALDRILQALTSQQGVSLVSLAVGVAARSSTQAYCECVERAASAAAAGGQPSALAESALPQLFRWAATPEGGSWLEGDCACQSSAVCLSARGDAAAGVLLGCHGRGRVLALGRVWCRVMPPARFCSEQQAALPLLLHWAAMSEGRLDA